MLGSEGDCSYQNTIEKLDIINEKEDEIWRGPSIGTADKVIDLTPNFLATNMITKQF